MCAPQDTSNWLRLQFSCILQSFRPAGQTTPLLNCWPKTWSVRRQAVPHGYSDMEDTQRTAYHHTGQLVGSVLAKERCEIRISVLQSIFFYYFCLPACGAGFLLFLLFFFFFFFRLSRRLKLPPQCDAVQLQPTTTQQYVTRYGRNECGRKMAFSHSQNTWRTYKSSLSYWFICFHSVAFDI